MSAEPQQTGRTAGDVAVLGICEVLALLFALPFGDALYHGTPITWGQTVYLVIGLVFAAAGPAWPYMKTKVRKKASAIFERMALDPRLWLPVLLIGFVYVIAPELYRRAMGPSDTPKESGAVTQTPEDVLKLIASLRAQLDSLTDALSAKTREFGIVKRDLEMARHPPARSGPLSTASLSLAMGKGTPREIAADNVRWIAWDARTRGSELRWSAPFSSSIILQTQPSYPDLSPFTDGEYDFTKAGANYKIFGAGTMTIIFLGFDKPVDTESIQLSS